MKDAHLPTMDLALRSIGMTVDVQSMDWATLLSRRSKDAPVEQGAGAFSIPA